MSRPVVIASMMREHGETGVQTHVRAVRDWLAAHGREVRLLTPFSNPRALVYPVFGVRRLIERLHKPTSVWWYRYWHAVFLRRALRRQLADGEPCVIYAQCPLSARAALDARVSPGQRVAMVAHFNLSQANEWADKGAIPRDGTRFRAIQAFEVATLPQLDALIYVSHFMRRELERRIPAVMHVPAQVIPNFLDDPGEPEAPAPEADLITVGTLEYRKNQRYALEIVHAAKQQGRRLTLTVVGDGPDRAMLETRAVELGIAEQVRFAGFVAHAAALMPAHRACLHVAHMESFGIVLIEALSRGLPVFAPSAGGMPEVFEDGIQGSLIPLDDAAKTARLIQQWLDDVTRMAEVRGLARRRFLERFEAERVAARLAGFLDDDFPVILEAENARKSTSV
jgi:glycosyltransferase involved in cell wall biosynthesis